jgi:hypothetical protein
LNALSELQNAALSASNISDLVKSAQSLAQTPTEKAEVARLAEAREAARLEEQSRNEQTLRPILDSFRARLARAESLAKDDPDDEEVTRIVAELQRDVPRLRTGQANRGEDLRAEVLRAMTRLETVDKNRKLGVEKERMLTALRQAATGIHHIDRLNAFVASCRQFAERFPDDPRSPSLRKSSEEKDLWESTVFWRDLVETWSRSKIFVAPNEATERALQIRNFVSEHPAAPQLPSLEPYLAHLQSIPRLVEAGGAQTRRSIQRLFTNPLVENLWWTKTKTGKTYYSLKKPILTDAGCQTFSLVDTNCNQKPAFINRINFLSMSESPQTRVAEQVKPFLAAPIASAGEWASAVFQIIAMLQSDQELEPILKVSLLIGVTQAAKEGDSLLGLALEPYAHVLEAAAVDPNTSWMNPDDDKAEPERTKARDALEQLPSIQSCRNALGELQKSLEYDLRRPYSPVGLMISDSKGTMRFHAVAPLAESTEVVVVLPGQGWKPLPRIRRDGDPIPRGGEPAVSQDGRVVFTR